MSAVEKLELKIPPVVLVLLLGTAMLGNARFVPSLGFVLPARLPLVAGLVVTGIATALLGVVSFRRAKTTVNPLHPETTSALVVSGIYRLTRNPMYLGMLLVLLGWGVFLAHALAFLSATAFIPLMNRLQILPEERMLADMFGSGFADYQSKVRRWL